MRLYNLKTNQVQETGKIVTILTGVRKGLKVRLSETKYPTVKINAESSGSIPSWQNLDPIVIGCEFREEVET